jgi:RNA polymerase sigma-70 factor (ECF subfamily)
MLDWAEARGSAGNASSRVSLNDDAAIVALAKHDREVFAVLYQRYVDRVYRYCYHRLGSREAAEDATAEVFVKALAALPRCRDDAFRSWLFAIAHNVIMDGYRSHRLAAPCVLADNVAAAIPTPEEDVMAAADFHSVLALLAQLPSDQRRVLELRLAGLTDVEIACVLDRSRGAVRAVQHRAVTRLRVLLGVDSKRERDMPPSDGDPGRSRWTS